MTDHLPECNEREVIGLDCICDRLRACEQRVLDAAREAVAAVCVELPDGRESRTGNRWTTEKVALAAIDALRQPDPGISEQAAYAAADAYAKGAADALDAAREAVADLTPFVFAYQTWISGDYGYDEGPWVKKENALAAIEALGGER